MSATIFSFVTPTAGLIRGGAAGPEKPSVFVERKPFDAIGCVAASGSDFSRNSLIVPCSREIASLLSRINSLFCLLGNFFVSNWIPVVFETDFRKKRLNRSNLPVFFPVSRGVPVFQETRRRPRQAAEELTVGTGRARKSRIVLAAAMRFSDL